MNEELDLRNYYGSAETTIKVAKVIEGNDGHSKAGWGWEIGKNGKTDKIVYFVSLWDGETHWNYKDDGETGEDEAELLDDWLGSFEDDYPYRFAEAGIYDVDDEWLREERFNYLKRYENNEHFVNRFDDYEEMKKYINDCKYIAYYPRGFANECNLIQAESQEDAERWIDENLERNDNEMWEWIDAERANELYCATGADFLSNVVDIDGANIAWDGDNLVVKDFVTWCAED